MVKINLLPWRDERRQQLTKEFYYMLAAAALIAGGIVFAGNYYFDKSIEFQNKRNQYLQSEITKLDAQIAEIKELEKKKSDLLARKEVIEELQASRTQMVHMFDEMVKTIPNGVFLEKINQQGNRISMEGYAQSHSRVSAYMRQLESSEWFKGVDVEFIKVDESIDTHDQKFKLGFLLINPNKQEKDAETDTAEGEDVS
ncbi:PilN domain-containing protein [Marinicella sp. W31]|uniref:PilN domain-containing protein n=1 Tax=Marinicella sp. W31 TaxID=3023713 RepID=UPI0037568AAC